MARLIWIPDRDGNPHPINCMTVHEFDPAILDKAPVLKDHRHKREVYDIEAAFDIETTTYSEDIAFMYVWQFCLRINGYYHVIMGRTWDEFRLLHKKIYGTSGDRWLVVFAHNLGFEYQNMYNFIPPHTVFAVKSRMPVKVSIEGWQAEYRCSWKLTNMSLEMATKKEHGVTYIKYPDHIDYKIKRFPDTKLSNEHLKYDVLDVVSLCDLVHNINLNNNDTLITMPMTSTGYVRRACRKRVRKEMPSYHDDVFTKCTMTADTYTALKKAARGGNTHANRYQVAGEYLL